MPDVAVLTLEIRSRKAETAARRTRNSLRSLNASQKTTQRQFRRSGRSVRKFATRVMMANRKIKRAMAGMRQATFSALVAMRSLRNLGFMAATAISAPLLAMGKIGVKTIANLERAQLEFGVLLRDMKKGRLLYHDLFQFGARTPLTMRGIETATRQLLANRAAGESLRKTLKMLGDLSMGQDARLERLSAAYGRVIQDGRVLRRQAKRFTKAGVPLMSVLRNMMGTSREGLRKMMSKGEVKARHMIAALQKLTSEGGEFHKMMLKVSKTLYGRWTTAIDNAELALGKLFEPFLDQMKEILIRVIKMTEWIQQTSTGFRRALVWVGAIAIAASLILLTVGIIGTVLATIASVLVVIVSMWAAIVAAAVVIGGIIGPIVATVIALRKEIAMIFDKITGGDLKTFMNRVDGFFANLKENVARIRAWIKKNWRHMIFVATRVIGIIMGAFISNMAVLALRFMAFIKAVAEWARRGPINNMLVDAGIMFTTIFIKAADVIAKHFGSALTKSYFSGLSERMRKLQRIFAGLQKVSPIYKIFGSPEAYGVVGKAMGLAASKIDSGTDTAAIGALRDSAKFSDILKRLMLELGDAGKLKGIPEKDRAMLDLWFSMFDKLNLNLKTMAESAEKGGKISQVEGDGDGLGITPRKLSEFARWGSREAVRLMVQAGPRSPQERQVKEQQKTNKRLDTLIDTVSMYYTVTTGAPLEVTK